MAAQNCIVRHRHGSPMRPCLPPERSEWIKVGGSTWPPRHVSVEGGVLPHAMAKPPPLPPVISWRRSGVGLEATTGASDDARGRATRVPITSRWSWRIWSGKRGGGGAASAVVAKTFEKREALDSDVGLGQSLKNNEVLSETNGNPKPSPHNFN